MGEIADALNRANKRKHSEGRIPASAPGGNSNNVCLATPRSDTHRIDPSAPNMPCDELRTSVAPSLVAMAEASLQHVTIPMDRRPGWESRICAVDAESPTAVRFRHLAIKIRALIEAKASRSVLVTSALSNEGKTTVTMNLALALASIAPDAQIALVDLDLRKGSLARALDYTPNKGIEGVLRGELSLESVRVTTDFPSLDFYPVFDLGTNSHRLLGAGAENMLKELSTRYDFVICDGPPGLLLPDVALIAPHVGGCLVVGRSRMTRHSTFKELISLLPQSSILGAFLNDDARSGGSDKYRYYAADVEPESAPAGESLVDDER